MADVEVEEFGVTEWDLDNEFNPNRVRYKQSKEDQIYGVWADHGDEDEEDERPSFRGASRGNAHKNISFISGGTAGGSKTEDQTATSEDVEEIEVKIPTKKVRNMAGPSGVFASERSALGSTIGSWEKYTKGIGAKLLLKMGYQPGKGLGKDLQGIQAPVEATLRKGKGAIGAYGPEKPAHRIPGTTGGMNVDAQELKQKREAKQWRKGEKKVKYIYKSLKEVQKEGATFIDHQTGPKVKVIDMTGPEQRVLSGYHQLSQQHHRPDEEPTSKGPQGNFSLPELEDNLDVLIETCENDIKRNTMRIESEKNRITNLRFEQERLLQEQNESERVRETLSKLSDALRELEDGCGPKAMRALSVGEVCMIFRRLVEDFEDEFDQFELSDLAPLIIFPLMKDFISSWQPLEKPSHGTEVFRQWKSILERPHRPRNAPDYFYRLMWEVWCPPVRMSVFRWSPRNPEPLVKLMETWRPIVPAGVINHLVEQIILPRIQQEVEQWNPLMDTVPIHSWIHPWLPFMSQSLETVYQPIRMKLSFALTNWHPSDSSAKLILEPWVGVMSKGSLEAFIATNIIPKLGAVLQSFIIDPRNQEFEPWQWFTAWGDIAPVPALVAVLEKYFFPQFHQVLFQWLQSSCNYDEVASWFSGWKAAFPDRVLADARIREQFRMALDLMNRAVSGQPIQPPRPIDFFPPPPPVQQQARDRFNAGSTPHNLNLTFKEILERRASERGVLFMPIPNRKQDGKQIYQLGTDRQLYLDRSVIFVFNGRTWVPTSMESLLDSC
ncbi:tuftelin-interacting protein 11-like [Tropilaelaps mercedesae]|uniref:Tuftelin-interacting protein 11-like n=1 Tax=Tropilaelaps mercedesae TaxID=418985 RepID=A0A1V9XM24_9ACAR|nr:tuftelin-interacting protein 11-like [Tropilaelaps mercedesae]